jgi:NAD(P)H dehydrogenase (quinone)
MPNLLVVYYTRSGSTEEMAKVIGEGAQEVEGMEVTVKSVGDTTPDDLLEADGIVMGSPVYYGTMAAELKRLIDESVKHHGKLTGKVGGAFATSGNPGGGSETTVVDILKALMIHGMVVQGMTKGAHYGPVSVGAPDERARGECLHYGAEIARLVTRVARGQV